MAALSPSAASEYIGASSREYGIYVNKTRHLPNFGDGLKDAMRKALHLMRSRKGRIKTIALAGAMQEALLYVHGDPSGSINSLAAPFGNNITLLVPQGNFGTRIEPAAFSAARYTEVERPSYAEELIYADYDIVPMEPNYDDSTVQPVCLLPIVPPLLINGMVGIGTGWSCTIFPRDPEEVVEAVASILSGKKPKQLTPKFTWCDSPVSAVGTAEGGGSTWSFSGRVTVKDTSTLHVTELPPHLFLETFRKQLSDMEDSEEIAGFEDESTDRISVTVKLKRGTAKGWTEEDAVKFLRIKQSRTENFVVMSWDNQSVIHYKFDPETGEDAATKYLRDWVSWRFTWFVKRFERFIEVDSDELLLMRTILKSRGLEKELSKMKDRSALRSAIGEKCSDIRPKGHHVDYVADMPAYRWTQESMEKVEKRARELEESLARHRKTLADEGARRSVFASDVSSLKPILKKAAEEVSRSRSAKP